MSNVKVPVSESGDISVVFPPSCLVCGDSSERSIPHKIRFMSKADPKRYYRGERTKMATLKLPYCEKHSRNVALRLAWGRHEGMYSIAVIAIVVLAYFAVALSSGNMSLLAPLADRAPVAVIIASVVIVGWFRLSKMLGIKTPPGLAANVPSEGEDRFSVIFGFENPSYASKFMEHNPGTTPYPDTPGPLS